MALHEGFALFPTALGECAAAWSKRGLTGVWLPDAIAARLRAKLGRRLAPVIEAPPPLEVAAAMSAMARLLSGEHLDLLT